MWLSMKWESFEDAKKRIEAEKAKKKESGTKTAEKKKTVKRSK